MNPDESERFYVGSTAGSCTICGSFGGLYHFDGNEDICPFCVIRVARGARREKATAEQIRDARGRYQDDDIQIDDDASVSRREDGGVWVQAWAYLSPPDEDE